MNEEGYAVIEIWRNKFTGENAEQTEREKQAAKQLGGLNGASGKDVSRHNVRPCTVWAPKLVRAKNIENLGFYYSLAVTL